MPFKVGNVDLSNIVYGWGTANTFGGFATSLVSDKLTTGGLTMKAVPRNVNFMPFSNVEITNGYIPDLLILRAVAWAQVNRFILSSTPKVTRTRISSDLIPIYYRGNGSRGLGTLYIGGGTSEYIVSSLCPPVVLIAFQAQGGNGGMGVAVKGLEAYTYMGANYGRSGGGGGSGGCAALYYWKLPTTTGLNLVGFCKINGDVTFYDAGGSELLVCNKGNKGLDGNVETDNRPDGSIIRITSVLHPSGGAEVSGVFTGISTNLDFVSAYQISQDGETHGLIAGGLAGRDGSAYFEPAIGSVSEDPASSGYSFYSTIYLNGLSDKTFSARSGGSAMKDGTSKQEGGGGGASRFGTGGDTRSGTGSGYGQGGGGGVAQYIEPTAGNYTKNTLAGGVGGSACVQFYW